MKNIRRKCASGVIVCIALGGLAACTSQSSDDDDAAPSSTAASGTETGSGNTVGITDDTIKISMISADLALLTEQNLAPEIGSADATMKAVVADINANGGIAGRQV